MAKAWSCGSGLWSHAASPGLYPLGPGLWALWLGIWYLSHGFVSGEWGGAAQNPSLGCDFCFLLYNRLGCRLPGRLRMHFL